MQATPGLWKNIRQTAELKNNYDIVTGRGLVDK